MISENDYKILLWRFDQMAYFFENLNDIDELEFCKSIFCFDVDQQTIKKQYRLNEFARRIIFIVLIDRVFDVINHIDEVEFFVKVEIYKELFNWIWMNEIKWREKQILNKFERNDLFDSRIFYFRVSKKDFFNVVDDRFFMKQFCLQFLQRFEQVSISWNVITKSVNEIQIRFE